MEDSLSVLSTDNSKDDPQSIATPSTKVLKTSSNYHPGTRFGISLGAEKLSSKSLMVSSRSSPSSSSSISSSAKETTSKETQNLSVATATAEDFLVMLLQSRGKHLMPLKNIIFWCILRDENYLRKKNKKLIYKTLRSKFWTGNAIFNLPRNGFYKFITTQTVQIQPEPPKY